MSRITYSHGVRYENKGITIDEIKQEIKDKLFGWLQKGKWTHYSMWLKKKPYLYIKAINECVDECNHWNPISWGNEHKSIGRQVIHLLPKADKKYEKYLREWAMKKIRHFLTPYVNYRLYRFPDGLRIKHIRESFYRSERILNNYKRKV